MRRDLHFCVVQHLWAHTPPASGFFEPLVSGRYFTDSLGPVAVLISPKPNTTRRGASGLHPPNELR